MRTLPLRDLIIGVACILVPLLVGFIGSLATMPNIPTWYALLSKPWFSPPNWVFGPVWTLLYILMGLSLWLVIKDGLSSPDVRKGALLFAVQLVLNLLWSWVFFGMQAPWAGFLVIVLLLLSIVATMLVFRKISRPAFLLLIPYICWVGFASVLNAAIWLLN